LCLPFASTPPIYNPSSCPTPKGGKTTMNRGEDPRRSGRASQHPNNLQEALQAPKSVSLSCKMRNRPNPYEKQD